MMSEGTAAQTAIEPGLHEGPTLQYELEPWGRVFRRNLGDLLLRREPPPLELTSEPGPIPPDIFVDKSLNWWRIAESYGGHIAFVAVVYFVSMAFFHKPVQLASPFQNTEIAYYPVSEYLPPINTGRKGVAKPRKGEPKLAKQEILSVPPNPDNRTQTIVAPSPLKLNRDVKLPNIVAWTPVPAAQPIAASSQSVSQLKIPQFQQQVIEPTADVSSLKPKLLVPPELRPTVVEPRADVSQLKAATKLPNITQPAAVEPSVSADALKLKAGQLNMAQLQPQVEAPKLPVPAQHAAANGDAAGGASAKAVPAQPSLQGLSNSKGQGQLIALGLSPADVRGPVEMPGGSRSGEFHASPGGKADAPGTPNVKGDASATTDGAGGAQGKGNGSGGNSNGLPSGLSVGNPPPGATTSAVAGTPSGKVDPKVEERKRIIAAAMNPSIPNTARRPVAPPESTPNLDDASVEARVFGKKQYYSLVLNTPNLSSASGSWIIHFAELKETDNKAKPTAPVALNAVDPAYTADAMRDRVEGTVTLYAVIRPDGSVTDIKVLNSLDDRLDISAIRALSRWHFRPGTKNGEAIALEAVVQIPFKMRKLQ
jgi:periplasmic protein TonB